MRVLFGVLIGILVLMSIAIIAFIWLLWFTDKKRAEATTRIMNIAKEKGISVSEIYVRRNIDRLNILDLYRLDKFLLAIEKKNYVEALGMIPEVQSVIKKTDLGIVFGALGVLVGLNAKNNQ